jgi:hypothetical protein
MIKNHKNYKEFRSAAYIAIFGALWGLTEILLGNLLHLFDIPFKGTILSALAAIICLVGAYLLPTKSKLPILAMGIIAIILRLLSFGVFKIHIFVSMFTSAILMQLATSLLGYNLVGFIVAGILSCFAPYISALLFFGLIYGQSILVLYHGILKEHNTIGLFIHSSIIIGLCILFLNVLLGILSGITALYCGKKLRHVSPTTTQN